MRRTYVALLAAAAMLVGCGGSPGDSASTTEATSTGGSTPATPSSTVTPMPGGWGPNEAELIEAAGMVDEMSRKEKVGSLLMPQFYGYSATKVTDEQAGQNKSSLGVRTAAAAIKRYHLGGAIVMTQNIDDAKQVKRLNDGLAATADPDLPLLLGVDQEGGIVQRVTKGATKYPAARTIGKTGKPANARLLAEANGTELRAMGFTLDFAPVADVGFDSPAIGNRAYADGPKRVGAMATAATNGYRAAGIVPVVKHFPGHGSATTDSHEELPQITRSKQQLRKTDLPPFERAIDAQVPAVLSGHLDMRAIDPGTPSTLSKPVVTGMLRKDLGFDGVTITDSQVMQPILDKYGAGEAAVRSVLAGQDIVLMPANLGKAYNALLTAARSGRLSANRLDAAATRVTALRLYAKRIGADRPSWSEVPWAKHRGYVRQVEAEAG
ncbi:MAG: beta-hexosaminidase [Streptosporangiales bacterium]|nr:beta-hexosaminidase [Streptosporangiales bacterium]